MWKGQGVKLLTYFLIGTGVSTLKSETKWI